MDFEFRPISSCPVWSIVAIPDVAGAFVITDKQSTCVTCVPLRGCHENVVFRSANFSIKTIVLDSSCEVQLVWLGNAAINCDSLFDYENENELNP